jgi:hypothetical protein
MAGVGRKSPIAQRLSTSLDVIVDGVEGRHARARVEYDDTGARIAAA